MVDGRRRAAKSARASHHLETAQLAADDQRGEVVAQTARGGFQRFQHLAFHLRLAGEHPQFAQSPAPTWLGLDVKRHVPDGDRAVVEFVARLRHGGGKAQRMHEVSRFVREDGRWYYVDGDVGSR